MEPIYLENEFISLYPEPDKYINSEHLAYFLPYAIYAYRKTDLGAAVQIPILVPIEPAEGLIGENTKDHHAEYCRENWLSYVFIDGLWKLDCDLKIFEQAQLDYPYHGGWYDQLKSSFEANKNFFKDNGFIQYFPDKEPEFERKSAIFYTGKAEEDNWSAYNVFPYEYREIPGSNMKEVILKDLDGNDFDFLGVVSGLSVAKPHVPSILYFYEPSTMRVLLTYNY